MTTQPAAILTFVGPAILTAEASLTSNRTQWLTLANYAVTTGASKADVLRVWNASKGTIAACLRAMRKATTNAWVARKASSLWADATCLCLNCHRLDSNCRC